MLMHFTAQRTTPTESLARGQAQCGAGVEIAVGANVAGASTTGLLLRTVADYTMLVVDSKILISSLTISAFYKHADGAAWARSIDGLTFHAVV
jgi:hypothetical protein